MGEKIPKIKQYKAENVMGYQRQISLEFTRLPPAGLDGVGAHGSFTIWPKLELLVIAGLEAGVTGLPHASTCLETMSSKMEN